MTVSKMGLTRVSCRKNFGTRHFWYMSVRAKILKISPNFKPGYQKIQNFMLFLIKDDLDFKNLSLSFLGVFKYLNGSCEKKLLHDLRIKIYCSIKF